MLTSRGVRGNWVSLDVELDTVTVFVFDDANWPMRLVTGFTDG